MENYFKLAGAIFGSIGGAGAIILALSSWLGKIWAQRILETDRRKYESEFALLKQQHEVSLKKYELRAGNSIQDVKASVIELAPTITQAWNNCSIFHEVCSFPDPSTELINEWEMLTQHALNELSIALQKSRLYIPHKNYELIHEYYTSIHAVSSELIKHVHPESISALLIRYVPRSLEQLADSLNALEQQENELINQLRMLIGTSG